MACMKEDVLREAALEVVDDYRLISSAVVVKVSKEHAYRNRKHYI